MNENAHRATTAPVDAAESLSRRIAVVIPCYRVRKHILEVIAAVPSEVSTIYVVDDCCPDQSGDFVLANCQDARVVVVRNEVNLGVGGAVMEGYRRSCVDGMDIAVKIDGDGQMDPSLLPIFVRPILEGAADYTKGNRFWDLRQIGQMPLTRRLGNLGLSFMSKASTGYWDIFDPTNGYTAIHTAVVRRLPFESISSRYFFETDLLFRLNTMRAVVVDVPMDARYGDEVSGLRVSAILGEFLTKHARNLAKRVIYNYFLRDLSIASLELLAAIALLGFSLAFGAFHWYQSVVSGVPAAVGTIMVATVGAVSGLQFLLAFLGYDIASVPKRPLAPLLARVDARPVGCARQVS